MQLKYLFSVLLEKGQAGEAITQPNLIRATLTPCWIPPSRMVHIITLGTFDHMHSPLLHFICLMFSTRAHGYTLKATKADWKQMLLFCKRFEEVKHYQAAPIVRGLFFLITALVLSLLSLRLYTCHSVCLVWTKAENVVLLWFRSVLLCAQIDTIEHQTKRLEQK